MAIPSKSQILHYWLTDDRLYLEHGILLDWGEPSCWACGFGWDGKYDVQDSRTEYSELLKLWERSPLQRCHVVPRALGGSDVPENLFLMCAECHDLAPDVTDRTFFFRWVKHQSYWTRSSQKINEALEALGLDAQNRQLLARLTAVLTAEDFQRWSAEHVGLHGRQRPPFGLRLKPTTTIAAVLMYVELQYPGMSLDEIPLPAELSWIT